MQLITHWLSQGFTNFAPFFILLGLLIFVHELGHFLVARLCGVRVEVFSLGFGKKILSYKPHETNYCISIFPMGGYVKMYGDDPTAEVPVEERDKAFLHKPIAQRIAIVLAGPLMNLFFAALLFMVIGRIGEEQPSAQLGDIRVPSAAAAAGFQSGDKILKVNGEDVKSWMDVQEKIESSIGQTLTFNVGRDQGPALIKAIPERKANENIFSFSHDVGSIDGFTNEALSAVVGVFPGSAAAQAGVRSLDLVVGINDESISSFHELEKAIEAGMTRTADHVRFKLRDVEADDKPENNRIVDVPLRHLVARHGKLLAALGIESAEMYIYKVKPKSPAAQAGFQAKDRIIEVDGKPANSWNQVLERFKNYTDGSAPIHFTLQRNGESVTAVVRPELTESVSPKGQDEKRYTIGIASGSFHVGPEPVLIQFKSVDQIVSHGLQQTVEWTGFMVMSLVRMAQGQVSAKNLSGIITIGRVASRSFEIGISAFLRTMAMISLNLFLINLFPVPVLDGGHILFFSLEALRGTPISLKKLEIAQQIGVTLLLILMLFAFFNDVTNLFSSHW